jgi:uncharacterized membrane protein YcjF (UPF0283 family)
MWSRLKKLVAAILVGVVAILAIILGVGYERKKIAQLKRSAELEKRLSEVKIARGKKDMVKAEIAGLSKEEEKIVERVKGIKRKMKDKREKTDDLEMSEVADRFNHRYFH